MKYAYIAAKRKGKVHEIDHTGRTYCQTENVTRRLSFVAEFPVGREACQVCQNVKAERLQQEMYEDFKRAIHEVEEVGI